MKLTGKVALVTGGAVRIGKAITLALAEAGCQIFIVYGQSAQEARETQAKVDSIGVDSHIYSVNLADAEATKKVIPAAMERFGQVDVLINSAAIFREGNLADTSLESWDLHFAVNLRSAFLLCQAFADQVPEDGQGAIVNISDARIFRPGTRHLAYRLTKSALLGMTENLALELAPRIRVNALALGAILPPPEEDQAYLDQLAQEKVPLRRAGSAEIVAENVIHLLEQDFITGDTIKLDGGQFL